MITKLAMTLRIKITNIQSPKTSVAAEIWQEISTGQQKYWRASDFLYLPIAAVLQTLSRLSRNGKLE